MDKFYEIREARSNDLLVDGLSSEQALKMFEIYQNYYGVGSVYITHYVVPKSTIKNPRTFENKRAQEYKNEFILLFAELQEMGNLL